MRATSTELDQVLEEAVAYERIPGATAATIHRGEITWRGAAGVRIPGGDDPVRSDTVFEAASLSKPVFAYGVLKLAERGLLELDSPLTEYVSEPYMEGDDRLNRITARHVLSHTTGFPNWRGDKPLQIDFDPGERFQYSGEGYVYLGKAVEAITGQPLFDWLRESVMVPLGMPMSEYGWRDEYEALAAHGEIWDRTPAPHKWKGKNPDVAGSLESTADEYARFLGAILTPPPADDHHLEAATIREMLRPHIPLEHTFCWGRGVGLDVTEGRETCWQWGSRPEFMSFCVGEPTEEFGVVVMTSSPYGMRVCREVVRHAMGYRYPPFTASVLWMY